VDARASKALGGGKSAKTCADDHHARVMCGITARGWMLHHWSFGMFSQACQLNPREARPFRSGSGPALDGAKKGAARPSILR